MLVILIKTTKTNYFKKQKKSCKSKKNLVKAKKTCGADRA